MKTIVHWAIATSLLVAACGGGDDKQTKTPDGAKTANAGQGGTAGSADLPPSTGLAGDAKDAYESGWKAWMEGDLPGAKAGFSKAAEKDPKSPAPHYALGIVNERLSDRAGALNAFRTSFTVKPDYEQGMCAYGLALLRGGNKGEADSFLSDKHAKLPESARIATCLAELKSQMNDSATAQQLAQGALKLDPDFKDAMITIARDHYRSHRMDLAKYALQAILEGFGASSPARDPNNPEALLVRGLIAREQKARRQAMTDFEAAVAKRPDMVEALVQAGSMKLEAGNAAEALPLLEKSIRFDPNNAIAHLNLGDAYRLLAKPDQAKKEFDVALSKDSSLAVAHYDLGLLYLLTPNFPGATPDSQLTSAIKEFETYKSMRGPKGDDDVDELLSRAKAKQAELRNAAAAAQPAASTAPAASAAPAKK